MRLYPWQNICEGDNSSQGRCNEGKLHSNGCDDGRHAFFISETQKTTRLSSQFATTTVLTSALVQLTDRCGFLIFSSFFLSFISYWLLLVVVWQGREQIIEALAKLDGQSHLVFGEDWSVGKELIQPVKCLDQFFVEVRWRCWCRRREIDGTLTRERQKTPSWFQRQGINLWPVDSRLAHRFNVTVYRLSQKILASVRVETEKNRECFSFSEVI